MFANAPRSYLIGVGTTYYVASISQYYFSILADCFYPSLSSDEFTVVKIESGDMVFAFSQSGETYDTKTALEYAKDHGAQTAAVVNVMGSAISMMVDQVIMQGSGPEICVVSTKAALAQTFIMIRVALELGLMQTRISRKEYEKHQLDLEEFPEMVKKVLNEQSGFVRNISTSYQSCRELAISRMRSLLSCGHGICVENEGSDLSACRRYAGRFSQTWNIVNG